VLVCSGRIAHDLLTRRDEAGARVAIVRVEQLAPWPTAQLAEVLKRYPGAAEITWVQEEPENMGPWSHVRDRIPTTDGMSLRLVSRPASASPASGSPRVHEREQSVLLDTAFS